MWKVKRVNTGEFYPSALEEPYLFSQEVMAIQLKDHLNKGAYNIRDISGAKLGGMWVGKRSQHKTCWILYKEVSNQWGEICP